MPLARSRLGKCVIASARRCAVGAVRRGCLGRHCSAGPPPSGSAIQPPLHVLRAPRNVRQRVLQGLPGVAALKIPAVSWCPSDFTSGAVDVRVGQDLVHLLQETVQSSQPCRGTRRQRRSRRWHGSPPKYGSRVIQLPHYECQENQFPLIKQVGDLALTAYYLLPNTPSCNCCVFLRRASAAAKQSACDCATEEKLSRPGTEGYTPS